MVAPMLADMALLHGARRLDEAAPAGDAPLADPERAAVLEGVQRQLGDLVRGKLGDPLARAGLVARVLVDGMSEPHASSMRTIVDAIGVTQDMIADMIEFWQVAIGGAVPVARRTTNLRPLCERVVDSLQARFPTNWFELEADSRVEGAWDPERIAAVVTRLALNGVHHGPPGGTVRVRVWGLDDRAVLSVRTAAPLAGDVPVSRLFEPFVCARPRRSDGETGIGLGLYLVDQVARAHRGRVDVKSSPLEGTIVRVALPRR
jgi:signal transduction histidine kinase